MHKKERALIIGGGGHLGSITVRKLIEKDLVDVFVSTRRRTDAALRNLTINSIKSDQFKYINIDISSDTSLYSALEQVKPKYIYFFAGSGFVQDSFKFPTDTIKINSIPIIKVLEFLRINLPESIVFFPSSSEGYKIMDDGFVNEHSVYEAASPYGISKICNHEFIKLYRDLYGLKIYLGIMFNCEGPLRQESYITRKITSHLTRFKASPKKTEICETGSFSSKRDFGSSEDYVEAIIMIMQSDKQIDNKDFVFATGKLTSVKELILFVAERLKIKLVFDFDKGFEYCYEKNSRRVVFKESKRYTRNKKFDLEKRGNPKKLLNFLSEWGGSRSIFEVLNEMITYDLSLIDEKNKIK